MGCSGRHHKWEAHMRQPAVPRLGLELFFHWATATAFWDMTTDKKVRYF
jgi:hypothetical protein